MSVSYKPQGVNTANVYVQVKDAATLIRFIEEVFGGTLHTKVLRPNGSIMHCEMRIKESTIMAGEASSTYEQCTAGIFVFVPDCDAVYKKAIDHGASPITPPATMPHAGERYGSVKDTNGNTWWIATHDE